MRTTKEGLLDTERNAKVGHDLRLKNEAQTRKTGLESFFWTLRSFNNLARDISQRRLSGDVQHSFTPEPYAHKIAARGQTLPFL